MEPKLGKIQALVWEFDLTNISKLIKNLNTSVLLLSSIGLFPLLFYANNEIDDFSKMGGLMAVRLFLAVPISVFEA